MTPWIYLHDSMEFHLKWIHNETKGQDPWIHNFVCPWEIQGMVLDPCQLELVGTA